MTQIRPHPSAVAKTVRHVVVLVALVAVCGLQGCATRVETLGLGIGLGAVGTVAGVSCVLTCSN
ncbi:MAG: hypothetical protein ACRYHA_22740 [Janthinobacterium lividum]